MAGEMALEAAQRGLGGLAFGFLARDVASGGRVVLGAGDGDGVQRAVELAVAAAVEPPRLSRYWVRFPEEQGIGAVPVCSAKAASERNC